MARNRNREGGANGEAIAAPAAATADDANRIGPQSPAADPSARARLCRLLELTDPTDAQLFGDAAARIEALQAGPIQKA